MAYAWVLGYSILFVIISAGLVVVSALKILTFHTLNACTISLCENVVLNSYPYVSVSQAKCGWIWYSGIDRISEWNGCETHI